MTAAELLSCMWGCTVTSYQLDVVHHSFHMTVECLEVDHSSKYNVDMVGVLSFSLTTDPSYLGQAYLIEPWNYIELTTIEASPINVRGVELWQVDAELWESQLRVVCADIVAGLVLNG